MGCNQSNVAYPKAATLTEEEKTRTREHLRDAAMQLSAHLQAMKATNATNGVNPGDVEMRDAEEEKESTATTSTTTTAPTTATTTATTATTATTTTTATTAATTTPTPEVIDDALVQRHTGKTMPKLVFAIEVCNRYPLSVMFGTNIVITKWPPSWESLENWKPLFNKSNKVKSGTRGLGKLVKGLLERLLSGDVNGVDQFGVSNPKSSFTKPCILKGKDLKFILSSISRPSWRKRYAPWMDIVANPLGTEAQQLQSWRNSVRFNTSEETPAEAAMRVEIACFPLPLQIKGWENLNYVASKGRSFYVPEEYRHTEGQLSSPYGNSAIGIDDLVDQSSTEQISTFLDSIKEMALPIELLGDIFEQFGLKMANNGSKNTYYGIHFDDGNTYNSYVILLGKFNDFSSSDPEEEEKKTRRTAMQLLNAGMLDICDHLYPPYQY